jgi:hypothetical protein
MVSSYIVTKRKVTSLDSASYISVNKIEFIQMDGLFKRSKP